MGRYYLLSKTVTENQSDEIIREMKEVPGVNMISVDQNGAELLVSTEDENFSFVMNNAVNICKRVAQVEMSFHKFAV